MENHPIPQDITGFQFKLIGSMTVRQFIYLAIGSIIAFLVFFILPIPLLIRLPVAVVAIAIGAGFAMVPIDGRPMDTMLINFIKALFAPTEYVYQKDDVIPLPGPTAPAQQTDQVLQQPIATPQTFQAPPPSPIPDPIPQPARAPVLDQSAPGPVIEYGTPQAEDPVKSQDEDEKLQEEEKIISDEKKLEEDTKNIQKELEQAKAEENSAASPQAVPEVHQKAVELEKILAETTRQKEELEKELLILRSKLESSQQEKFTPSGASAPKQTENVRSVPKTQAKAAGIPNAPEDPNLITGIVKDPRGNPLPNILVEVKDNEDNPVRAFKTNGLGQFASATSLSNGKYSVTFEDPKEQNKFDAVEIEATGAVIMPLEVISVDPREELRRELFN